jgi:hypothetical protein
MHDEEEFPDPEGFIPERYLEKTEAGWKYVPAKIDPRVVNFGYGRRCVLVYLPYLTRGLTSRWNRVCPGAVLNTEVYTKAHSYRTSVDAGYIDLVRLRPITDLPTRV